MCSSLFYGPEKPCVSADFMKNTSYPASRSMALHASRLVVAMWLAHLSPTLAQGQNQGSNTAAEIERQRTATRAMVDQVTADQFKPSDTATRLGHELPAALKPLLPRSADQRQGAAKPAVRSAT